LLFGPRDVCGRPIAIRACVLATLAPSSHPLVPLFYRPVSGRFSGDDLVVAITRKSLAAAAEKAARADLESSVGLDELSAPIAGRVLRYAATLGLGRDAPWYTRPGLEILAKAAAVVADHLVTEREDSCDLDAFALRRMARRWRKWIARRG